LLNHWLFRNVGVLVVWIGRWNVLPSGHLAGASTDSRSGSVWTEHDAFHAAWIVHCAHENEVIAGSVQD